MARYLRRRILNDGCGTLLIDIAQFLEEQQLFDTWNRHRFGQLVALGLQYEKRNELRVSRFVTLIESTQVSDPMAAPVRIMTVHAAKGLEFDVVVMPFFNGGNKPRNPLISQRVDAREGFNLLSLTPAAAIIPFSGPLKAMQAEKVSAEVQEDLCVLYVAMTRARQRLEIILPPSIRHSTIFQTENLLRSTLRDEFLAPLKIPHAKVLWHNATQVAFAYAAKAETSAAEVGAALPSQIVLQASQGLRSLPRWSPSGGEDGGRVAGASLLSTHATAARARGIAIHRLFEDVGWLENFQSNDQRLLHLLSECGYSGSAAMDLIASFRDALDQPEVQQLLSRPQEQQDCEIWRELPFAVATVDEHGSDSILNGIFDRVVVYQSGGQITHATIIDFKTGAVAGQLDLISKTNDYRGQMRAYRKALAVRTGLDHQKIACKLLFVDAGCVATV